MKIVHIVVRNTSTLDYSIPYLCFLRKQFEQAEISVFYCVSNRKQMLRNANYYNRVFDEYSIKQYDFSDFLKFNNSFLKSIWKKIFSFSYYDHISLHSFLKNPLFLGGKAIKYTMAGPRKKFDKWMCSKIVDTKKIITTLDPDLTLLDHRARVDFIGKNDFIEFYTKQKRPVVLVPHAAHVDNESDEFSPFSLGDEDFPEYCDHWCSFKFAKPYLKVPEAQRSQFQMIGHPGLDSAWIKRSITSRQREVKEKGIKILRCLVLSRKFLPEGQKRPKGMDPGVLEFDDVVKFFKQIENSLKETGRQYEILVKPHPSSSYPENIRALKKAGVKNVDISYEPFFELLPDTDLMITEFSTSIAFSVLANVPTIVLNSSLQDYVHNSWIKLKELYSGLRYYVENPSIDLPKMVANVVKDLDKNDFDLISNNEDVEHFRNFYEDNAISRALLRTKALLN